jgi:hypothetical protein
MLGVRLNDREENSVTDMALPGENNRRVSQTPEVIEILWINGSLMRGEEDG